MVNYKDLIAFNDPLIPPIDSQSNAIYTNTKQDILLPKIDRQIPTPQSEVVQPNENHTTIDNWNIRKVLAGAHQGWVRALEIDPVTNQWFVSGGTDSVIKVWDLATLNLRATITGHIMAVRALKVSQRSPYLFSGAEDKTVRCFDLERSNSPLGCEIRKYHGHLGGVYSLALHPELDILFTGGSDSVIRVWDIRSRTEVMTLTGHSNDISAIIASESDPQIISSSMDQTIRLWDLRKQTTELTISQHSKSIRLMIDHPTESTFVSGDSLGKIKQWVLPQGDLLNEFGSSSGVINTLAINPAINCLFTGFDNGNFEVYDYVSGNILQQGQTQPLPGSQQLAILTSAFDLSGLRLLTGESDHSIKIWGQDD